MELEGTRTESEGAAAVVAGHPFPSLPASCYPDDLWGPEAQDADPLGGVRGPWGEDRPDPEELEAAEFWASIEAQLVDEPPSGHPSDELLAGLRAAIRGVGRTALGTDERSMLFGSAVRDGLEELALLGVQMAATTYALVAEALDRGLHLEVGLGLVDWLRVRIPRMSKREATAYASVAEIARRPWGAVLGAAMAQGRVALHRAAKVARTMKRLTTSMDAEGLAAYTQIATEAACNPDLSDAELDIVCAKLIELLLKEKEPGQRERTAWELRNVSRRDIGDGLTRFSIDAPGAAAATLSGILTSELAAPRPAEDGTPDPRFPGQRRFDAMMAVINRGLSNPGAPPSQARAAVILTLPFDAEKGAPTGPMTSPTGDYVPPRQAALLACSADTTPVWLSMDGAPLKLGDTKRYATPEQWKALVVRDRHCTFPGCTVPPQWCDSHHIIWWSREGDTDILNLALLCGRHHTFVHLNDLVATIVGGTVIWHV